MTLLMLLVACSDRQPAGLADAGSPDVGLSSVRGLIYTTCHQILGDIDLPTDLSTAVIQVLVPDDSPAGYRVVNGHGDASGGFVIDDVPNGITFTLRINDDYYVTDQHMVDLRSETAARCAPPPEQASSPTPVTLRMTG
ncbi:MAG TPA: hypothetical protein VLM79_23835, partial [Kofleriaceae bacterium]|nr:hypothetical protein [Kofleriaceae bacterium]